MKRFCLNCFLLGRVVRMSADHCPVCNESMGIVPGNCGASMVEEKDIRGQMELVRFQSEKVVEVLERFQTTNPPVRPDELFRLARALRNSADEIETLGGMLNGYAGISQEDSAADLERAAAV